MCSDGIEMHNGKSRRERTTQIKACRVAAEDIP